MRTRRRGARSSCIENPISRQSPPCGGREPGVGPGPRPRKSRAWNDAHTLTRPLGSLTQCRRRYHGRADRTPFHLGRRFGPSGVLTPALCSQRSTCTRMASTARARTSRPKLPMVELHVPLSDMTGNIGCGPMSSACSLPRMPILVRPITPADLDEVVALALRAWEPVHASMATVLGEDLNARVYPDWAASQATEVANAFHRPALASVGRYRSASSSWFRRTDDRLRHPDWRGRHDRR
jgi:hypothetical protein